MLSKLVLFVALFFPLSVLADNAVLTWTAVTKDTASKDITGVQYRVYKSSGGLLATVGTLTYTVQNYIESCWFVTAVTSDGESAKSNVACKTVPAAPPVATTLTVK